MRKRGLACPLGVPALKVRLIQLTRFQHVHKAGHNIFHDIWVGLPDGVALTVDQEIRVDTHHLDTLLIDKVCSWRAHLAKLSSLDCVSSSAGSPQTVAIDSLFALSLSKGLSGVSIKRR